MDEGTDVPGACIPVAEADAEAALKGLDDGSGGSSLGDLLPGIGCGLLTGAGAKPSVSSRGLPLALVSGASILRSAGSGPPSLGKRSAGLKALEGRRPLSPSAGWCGRVPAPETLESASSARRDADSCTVGIDCGALACRSSPDLWLARLWASIAATTVGGRRRWRCQQRCVLAARRTL